MKLKLIKGILGCALAAGLMTFATGKAQAGIVIDNTFYEPLNVKLTVTFTDDNGKLKKATVTSKTILKKLGIKNSTLADSDNGEDGFDVFVVNTKTQETEDLTADGVMTETWNELVFQDTTKKNQNESFKSSGIVELALDSNGGLESPAVVANAAPSFNGTYTFDISGIYTETFSQSNDDKNGNFNLKDKTSAPQMSGTGTDSDLSEDTLPVAGNAKWSGSGKLQDL